jgi:hypothetical protein
MPEAAPYSYADFTGAGAVPDFSVPEPAPEAEFHAPLLTATHPQTGDRVVHLDNLWQPIEESATHPDGRHAYKVNGQWVVSPPHPLGVPWASGTQHSG